MTNRFCLLFVAFLIFCCIISSTALNSDQFAYLQSISDHWSLPTKAAPEWATTTASTACIDLAVQAGAVHGVTCSQDQTVVTELQLRGLGLTGNIPQDIFKLNNLTKLWLHDNGIEGTIPNQISNYTNMVTIYLHNNQLSGTIPQAVGSMLKLREWTIGNNRINGTIPDELANLPLLDYISMSNNMLSGTIPPALIDRPILKAVWLENNMLTGPVPNLTSDWRYISFNNNSLDLCPEGLSVKVSANQISCDLRLQKGQESCRVDCQEMWANLSCSFDSILPDPCPDPAANCAGIRPSPSFQCYGGVWVANSTIDEEVLVIGGGTTQVTGNLTISTSLNFNGLGTIIVDECLRLLNASISLDLSESDLENLVNGGSKTKTLLKSKLNGTVCGEGDVLQTVPISLSQPKSCKKVSISSLGGEARTLLTVSFKVDKSRCSLWWIILASVLGAVILLVVVAILLVSFVPAIKRKVRPFWMRNKRTAMEHHPTRSGTNGPSKPCECCSGEIHQHGR